MISIYRCVACGRTPLTSSRTAFSCVHCGSRYPIVFNVPMFVPTLRCSPSGFQLDREAAVAIVRRTGGRRSQVSDYILKQIHSYDYAFGDNKSYASRNRVLLDAMKECEANNAQRTLSRNPNAEVNGLREPGTRGLEIGSKTSAVGSPLPTVYVDTDVHAMQIGQWACCDDLGELRFIVADPSELPFDEGSFDVVVCSEPGFRAFKIRGAIQAAA